MDNAGVDPEALLDTYIRAINVITQGRPNDLTIGVHMCRGNYIVTSFYPQIEFIAFTEAPLQGTHFAEGSYSRIAFKIFNRLDVDVFYVRRTFC
jgi:methionine synthase II (cobalamin-independent)